MLKNSKLYCDICKAELQQVRYDHEFLGWPWQTARAHVCNQCFDEAFDAQWKEDDPCGRCEGKPPCEAGRDCWYTPPILSYETYYANRFRPISEKTSRR